MGSLQAIYKKMNKVIMRLNINNWLFIFHVCG
jgi:hypothetical protein